MADTFPLELVTPTGIVFEGEVAQVNAWGPLGQFGVLPLHVNFITSLFPGIVEVVLPGGEVLHYLVTGGLTEVKDGKMTVLADNAEEPESINAAEAEAQIGEAEEKLINLSMYDERYEPLHHDLLAARARRAAAQPH